MLKPASDRQRVLNRAATAVSKEKPDEAGAIATLLALIAVEHLRLKPGDPQVPRLRAIANEVLKAHGDDIVNPASAVRLAEEMVGLAVTDYTRVQGAAPSGDSQA